MESTADLDATQVTTTNIKRTFTFPKDTKNASYEKEMHLVVCLVHLEAHGSRKIRKAAYCFHLVAHDSTCLVQA